jgi:hypothetical protein
MTNRTVYFDNSGELTLSSARRAGKLNNCFSAVEALLGHVFDNNLTSENVLSHPNIEIDMNLRGTD